MIELAALSPSDATHFLEVTWTEYRESLLGAGFSAQEADLNIERNKSEILDGGFPRPHHHFLDIRHENQSVGTLWLASQEDRAPGQWFGYEFTIQPAYRSRGLGRETMRAAEHYVLAHGGTSIALNVFGPNTIARALYESMGYEIQNIGMKKTLS